MKQATADAALASRVQAALDSAAKNVTIDTTGIADRPYASNVVTVTLDLTSTVMSGNTYRASAVQDALNGYKASVASAGKFNLSSGTYYSSFCSDGGVNFHLVGVVQFDGSVQNVGTSGFCAKLQ